MQWVQIPLGLHDVRTDSELCNSSLHDQIDHDSRLCELWEMHVGDGPEAFAAPLEDFGGPSAGGGLVADLQSLLVALHHLGLVSLADGEGEL